VYRPTIDPLALLTATFDQRPVRLVDLRVAADWKPHWISMAFQPASAAASA
jgi:hypothetical protein